MNTTDQTIAELASLLAEQGSLDYYGESVSQLEHMLQCAVLAERAGADNETVIASFLHGIGHLLPVEPGSSYMDNDGRINYQKLGADWLRRHGFSEKIAQLVEQHVNAKRYLTFKNPAYFESLPESGPKTPDFQGEPMTEQEARKFERNSHFRGILQVRRWDEQAWELRGNLPAAERYLEKCRTYLQAGKR